MIEGLQTFEYAISNNEIKEEVEEENVSFVLLPYNNDDIKTTYWKYKIRDDIE